ncbi:hypothetical protein PVL30_001118 [Lodderomyces elongisporus]|uniref:uncharacterized protein n=1 Tax=Lodderomyces elongisporus TaxID=36914 RepID=UPI002924FD57|nr:uncharacterized protein PVL30_001118 [Lodderomyces elongisporus]WLF77403.1 hypothetical protein PVL30_001118 [Lodderomyces elongisporus]
MPSPIWISNSSGYFTPTIVLKSIELTTVSICKSITNSQFYTSHNVHLFLKYLILSVLLYVFINCPVNIAKLVVWRIYNARDATRITGELNLFFTHYFNLNCFCMTLYSFFDTDLEKLFLLNLKHTDKLNGTKYCEHYSALPNHFTAVGGDNVYSLNHLFKFSREFKSFVKRYSNYYMLNLVVFSCIYILPHSISTTVLAFITFSSVLDKIGTVFSIIVTAMLQMSDAYYTALFLTTFYGSCLLAEDLLIPYFNKVQFTNVEKSQWINTRKGVLFGIGLCYFLAVQKFPMIAMIIYSNALFNMGAIITKISSEIPKNSTKEMGRWAITESVWDGHEAFVKESYGLF